MTTRKDSEPVSATETPLEEGTFVWVSPNPPTHAAYPCQCSNSGCGNYIWGENLAVRDKRGKWRSLQCAVREKITTWEETEVAFQELLRLRGIPTAEERRAAEREAEEQKHKAPKRRTQTKGSGGKPRLPRGMIRSSTNSLDLANDALANAPAHVRERMAKRQRGTT